MTSEMDYAVVRRVKRIEALCIYKNVEMIGDCQSENAFTGANTAANDNMDAFIVVDARSLK